MVEKIAFESGRISNFEGLMTLTLTMEKVILHTLPPPYTTRTYTAHTYQFPPLPGLAHWTDIKVSALGSRVGWTPARNKERTNDTGVHHSSTSTYMPNFTETEEIFCGRTDERTYTWTDGRTFETHHIRSTLQS